MTTSDPTPRTRAIAEALWHRLCAVERKQPAMSDLAEALAPEIERALAAAIEVIENDDTLQIERDEAWAAALAALREETR